MSQENADRHRRIYDALNASDLDALLALCDPAIEVLSVFAAVGGAVYQGHDGVKTWLRELEESWGGEFRVKSEAFFVVGENTVVEAVLRGRGGQSGVAAAMPATGIATWREGLCISHKAYARREDALRELGVSENALVPIDPE